MSVTKITHQELKITKIGGGHQARSNTFLKMCVGFWGFTLTSRETVNTQTMAPEEEHIHST